MCDETVIHPAVLGGRKIQRPHSQSPDLPCTGSTYMVNKTGLKAPSFTLSFKPHVTENMASAETNGRHHSAGSEASFFAMLGSDLN